MWLLYQWRIGSAWLLLIWRELPPHDIWVDWYRERDGDWTSYHLFVCPWFIELKPLN